MDREVKAIIMNRLKDINFDDVYDYTCLYTPANVYSGATRYVIVFDDLDYVVKIPKAKYYNEYNRAECDNYKDALTYGVGEYFAETIYAGRIKGYLIEIQEKFECNEEEVESYLYEKLSSDEVVREEFENTKEYMAVYDDEDEDDLYNRYVSGCVDELCDDAANFVANLFGISYHSPICSFLESQGINDIHSGNVAIDGDYWRIIDFAGYHG